MTAAGLPVPPGFVDLRRGCSRRRSTASACARSPRAGDHAGAEALVPAARAGRDARSRRPTTQLGGGHGRGPLVGVRRGLRGRQLRRPAGDVPERRGRGGGAARRVVECWASFFSERALFYRSRKGSLDDLRMAVVVQQMVAPEKSGVLFTVDPVQRRRDRMVVEAVFGLGEQVVSGEVTPDHYVVDRDGGVKRERLDERGRPRARRAAPPGGARLARSRSASAPAGHRVGDRGTDSSTSSSRGR